MGSVSFPRVAENGFLTAELWMNLVSSVSLSIFICKMGVMMLLQRAVVRRPWAPRA